MQPLGDVQDLRPIATFHYVVFGCPCLSPDRIQRLQSVDFPGHRDTIPSEKSTFRRLTFLVDEGQQRQNPRPFDGFGQVALLFCG
jgi:hypothetical protein